MENELWELIWRLIPFKQNFKMQLDGFAVCSYLTGTTTENIRGFILVAVVHTASDPQCEPLPCTRSQTPSQQGNHLHQAGLFLQ